MTEAQSDFRRLSPAEMGAQRHQLYWWIATYIVIAPISFASAFLVPWHKFLNHMWSEGIATILGISPVAGLLYVGIWVLQRHRLKIMQPLKEELLARNALFELWKTCIDKYDALRKETDEARESFSYSVRREAKQRLRTGAEAIQREAEPLLTILGRRRGLQPWLPRRNPRR